MIEYKLPQKSDIMKLALVSLDKSGGTPPLGLAYIASYLRKYGNFYNTVIIDKEDPIKRIKKEKPDVVGISAVTGEYGNVIKLSEEIKDLFGMITIVGGSHISTMPRNFHKTFDVGVIGEGEQTMLELIQLYEKVGEFPKDKLKKIDGLVFQEGETIHITNPRKEIKDIDSIPYPARDLLKMKEVYLQPKTIPHIHGKIGIGTHMIPSRGCPYRCKFCSTMWKGVRYHSSEYIAGEIKSLLENYKKIQYISFYDDLFIANKKRLEDLVKLLREEGINERVEFGCWGRANLMNDEVCKLLVDMNLKSLSFGFESNSDKVLRYLKDNVTPEDNRRAVEICNKHNISITGSFMFGNPGETKEDIEKTFDFIKKYIKRYAQVFITTPLPGTKIWELAKEKKLVYDDISWKELDKINFRDTERVFFLPDDMTEEEFFDKIAEIRNFVKEREERIDANISLIFNPFIIKKAIRNPKRMFSFLNKIIKGKQSNFNSFIKGYIPSKKIQKNP